MRRATLSRELPGLPATWSFKKSDAETALERAGSRVRVKRNGNAVDTVPRFFITEYFRAFRPSVILTILQWYQHINWRNDCWVGIARLRERTGWTRRSVYDALRTLGKQKEWERRSQELPRPLEISRTAQQQTRHFRVLAVAYEQKKRRNQRSTVNLTPEFVRHFRVRGFERIDIDFREGTCDGDGDAEADASADTDFDADADIDTDADGNVDAD